MYRSRRPTSFNNWSRRPNSFDDLSPRPWRGEDSSLSCRNGRGWQRRVRVQGEKQTPCGGGWRVLWNLDAIFNSIMGAVNHSFREKYSSRGRTSSNSSSRGRNNDEVERSVWEKLEKVVVLRFATALHDAPWTAPAQRSGGRFRADWTHVSVMGAIKSQFSVKVLGTEPNFAQKLGTEPN